MACPRCGSETRPGQKFCAECGLALSAGCPHCGAPYEGNPKFCAECGTALPPADAAEGTAESRRTGQLPAAERRYVSVLFADLVGFTALSEQHDPEEVRDLLSRYFDLARQVIDGYGGSVEKFIGDAVMAIWGAPVAREDDPERAVRAALELVDRVKGLVIGDQALALRAAVLSGEAAVTPGRTGEGMVAGDLVNTASRLQSVAPSGVVLVGESTYRATSAAIAFEAAGDQLLKGKEAPVAAWRALRVVARVGGEGRDDALEPPFVGRDEELRLLKDQVHAAEREGRLRMVAVSGQAGIGKTRLVWELEKYLDGLAGPQLYYWHQGRSPAYGEGVAFWALGEMVRRRAMIAEGEDAAATREKLQAALAQFVPDPTERRWLEPALGALLGIDQADWDAREQLFSAWRTFFERVADQGPTVLVFEDLQWADNGLLDFVEHLLEWARDKPILIISLARPELLDRRPNFGLGHRALLALHLEPLPAGAMRDIVLGLVPALGERELERIIERAEGVPLYAVETIRALVDGGHLVRRGDAYQPSGELPVLEVPPTLRALISSRLDALDADDRRLLQEASVIGQTFAVPALAALTDLAEADVDARLRALARKEIVELETDPRSPERGQFGFKQSLIREVAYAMMSKRERRARHLAAARYYDTLGDDELAGVLATHYLEAFRAAPEGEEGAAVAAQARVALRGAAERAQQLHSNLQALEYYEQAIAVTFDDTELNELRVKAARAGVQAGRYERAEGHMKAAIAWSAAQPDRERTVEWMAAMAASLLESSRVDEALALLTEAEALQPGSNGKAQIYLFGQIARAHLFRAEGKAGLAAVERAIEAAERLHYRAPTLHLLITKAWALGQVGRRREEMVLLTGAMATADREGDLNAQTRSRFNLSGTLLLDDPRRALQVALDGMELMERYGLNPASMAGNAASIALMIGDIDEVFRLEAQIAQTDTTLGAFIHGDAACAAALRGDAEGTRTRIAEVERAVAAASSTQDIREARHHQAIIAFAEGRLADARPLAIEAVELYPISAGAAQARVLAGHVAVLQGDLASLEQDLAWISQGAGFTWVDAAQRTLEAAALALRGQADEAARLYREVINGWREAELQLDLGLALLERALLLGAIDREAADGLDEARQVFAAMGAEGLLERLEAGAARPTGAAPKRSPALRSEDGAAARR